MDLLACPIHRRAVLSIVILLSFALASCVPPPAAPAPATAATTPTLSQAPASPTPANTATVAEGPEDEAVFTDPSGRFTVPVPTNWRAETTEGFAVLRDPEDAIKAYIVVVPGGDMEQAIADAWAVADPSFALPQDQTVAPPSNPGIDDTLIITYDAGDERFVQAVGQRVKDQVYVLLFDGGLDAVTRRSPQLNIVYTGLTVTGTERVDLANVAAQTLTPELFDQLESYITEAMELAHIPAAAVAVVQNNQVVYLKGFGVRELGKPDPVTPDTLMMIGSTTKTMTTMMMARLADKGRMAWDTPAVEFLPSFAVADPVLTQKITMRNLVCACTGVPRRDLEIIFNAGSFTAEDIVASLRSFEFFTGFGEAFQYSNQMVATGGYLAALAGGGRSDDLYGAYLEQMQQRVFDPIGMPNTTFDFDEVTASPDYAIPHGANALHEFSPVPVSSEQVLIPVAPAGAAWSNARDMARYLITEMNEGVSPDGVRVVSAENLRVTWEPQVPVAAETSYGLGWFVDHYQGLPLLHHGGNTAGFTTDLAFLPGVDLGIVVITNARLSNYFNEAVRFRLFELAFDQPAEHDAQFQFTLESLAKADQDLSLELLPGADPEAVAPYLGTFSNLALGDMTLSMTGDRLMMDVGEFATELRPRVDADGRTTYIMYGPLWAGYALEFEQGSDGGEPSIVVLSPPDKYIFTRK